MFCMCFLYGSEPMLIQRISFGLEALLENILKSYKNNVVLSFNMPIPRRDTLTLQGLKLVYNNPAGLPCSKYNLT